MYDIVTLEYAQKEFNIDKRLAKQSRYWVTTLYPDNESHMFALEIAKNMYNSIIMLHDRTIDPDTLETMKPHYHIIWRWEQGYYLNKLINYLCLSRDDVHLFLTLTEINFKAYKDYIIYLTHKNTTSKEIYSELGFMGGNRQYAIELCMNLSIDNNEFTTDVLKYLENWKQSDIYFNQKSLAEIYLHLLNKYGYQIKKNWSFIKDFIKDYKSYYKY